MNVRPPGYTHTSVFIAALFRIARTWKQTRCPSADESMKKVWYIHTMEYYSSIKRMKFCHLQHECNLKSIVLSEINQTKTKTVCHLLHIKSNQ